MQVYSQRFRNWAVTVAARLIAADGKGGEVAAFDGDPSGRFISLRRIGRNGWTEFQLWFTPPPVLNLGFKAAGFLKWWSLSVQLWSAQWILTAKIYIQDTRQNFRNAPWILQVKLKICSFLLKQMYQAYENKTIRYGWIPPPGWNENCRGLHYQFAALILVNIGMRNWY